MKFFIVVILAAICGSAVCDKAEWDSQAMQCAQKFNVKVEDMKKAINGNMNGTDVTSDMKCFTLCMAEKGKIMKDGEFQPEALAEKMTSPEDKEKMAKITSECNVKGANDCDTAFKLVTCIAKNKMHKM